VGKRNSNLEPCIYNVHTTSFFFLLADITWPRPWIHNTTITNTDRNSHSSSSHIHPMLGSHMIPPHLQKIPFLKLIHHTSSYICTAMNTVEYPNCHKNTFYTSFFHLPSFVSPYQDLTRNARAFVSGLKGWYDLFLLKQSYNRSRDLSRGTPSMIAPDTVYPVCFFG
jgi:hypothetical protein